jgi:hypothetical protein
VYLRHGSKARYGWVANPYWNPLLDSTRQGLSPCKIRRALLGQLIFFSIKYSIIRFLFVTSRGRNASHPAPPAQSRTCGFPASGSSVRLASARTFTVTRYKIQLLFPAVRLAHVIQPYMSGTSFLCGLRPSVRSFPLHAWCTHVCGWLSQPLSTMPDKTPQWHVVALQRPT